MTQICLPVKVTFLDCSEDMLAQVNEICGRGDCVVHVALGVGVGDWGILKARGQDKNRCGNTINSKSSPTCLGRGMLPLSEW